MNTIRRWHLPRPARLFAIAATVAWGAFYIAGAANGAGADAKAATHNVVIDGVKYEPATLTVQQGDAVVWVNKDPFPHTVTAPGAFDSHSIAAGGSWRFVARKAGVYDYICTLHPNMKGTLRVE